MNEFVERSPGGKLFHSCEHPPFSILRCITTLRLLAGVRNKLFPKDPPIPD